MTSRAGVSRGSGDRLTRDEAEALAFLPRVKRQFAAAQKGPSVRRGQSVALPRSRRRKKEAQQWTRA